MAGAWYIQIMGEVIGPLSPGDLREKVASGTIQRDTLVRKGDSDWVLAEDVRGLFDVPSGAKGSEAKPLPARVAAPRPSGPGPAKQVEATTSQATGRGYRRIALWAGGCGCAALAALTVWFLWPSGAAPQSRGQRSDPAPKEGVGAPIGNAAGPPAGKGDVFAAARRVKTDVAARLRSLGDPQILKASVSVGGEAAAAFMLLAEYDEENRQVFLARMEAIPRETVDAWSEKLSNKSRGFIDRGVLFRRLPHFDTLFNQGRLNESTSQSYLRRIDGIPEHVLTKWVEALRRFDDRDHYPVSNTLLLMVQTEQLFDPSSARLLEKRSELMLSRLRKLDAELLTKLAATVDYENLKLLAVRIAAEDDLFEGDELRREAAATLLQKPSQ